MDGLPPPGHSAVPWSPGKETTLRGEALKTASATGSIRLPVPIETALRSGSLAVATCLVTYGLAGSVLAADLCLFGVGSSESNWTLSAYTPGFSTTGAVCTTQSCNDGIRLLVSPSPVDPLATSDTVPTDGQLFLWFECVSGGYGYTFAGLLDASGSLDVVGYTPLVGEGSWDGVSIYYGAGPFYATTPMGIIHVEDHATSAPLIETSTWGRVKALFD